MKYLFQNLRLSIQVLKKVLNDTESLTPPVIARSLQTAITGRHKRISQRVEIEAIRKHLLVPQCKTCVKCMDCLRRQVGVGCEGSHGKLYQIQRSFLNERIVHKDIQSIAEAAKCLGTLKNEDNEYKNSKGILSPQTW